MRHRVLCFGGRDYCDTRAVAGVLQKLLDAWGPDSFAVIHGGARGADSLCGAWAASKGLPVVAVAANWELFGKAAGGIRNQWMLDVCAPTYAVGFPGGPGSRNMAERVKKAGLPLWLPFALDDADK